VVSTILSPADQITQHDIWYALKESGRSGVTLLMRECGLEILPPEITATVVLLYKSFDNIFNDALTIAFSDTVQNLRATNLLAYENYVVRHARFPDVVDAMVSHKDAADIIWSKIEPPHKPVIVRE
jgi:hypothetical protein